MPPFLSFRRRLATELRVREMDELDVTAVRRIVHDCLTDVMALVHSPEIIRKLKAEFTEEFLLRQLGFKQVLVATRGNLIVGTASLADFHGQNGRLSFVSNFYVAPKEHGNGAGRLLLEAIMTTAVEFGVRKLKVPSSRNARGFYSHFGFVRSTEQPDIAGEITWMERSLSEASV